LRELAKQKALARVHATALARVPLLWAAALGGWQRRVCVNPSATSTAVFSAAVSESEWRHTRTRTATRHGSRMDLADSTELKHGGRVTD